jgi:hypothetical protein
MTMKVWTYDQTDKNNQKRTDANTRIQDQFNALIANSPLQAVQLPDDDAEAITFMITN